MPATRRLVLDLPEETVVAIEARVAAGGCVNAAEAIVAAVADTAPSDREDTPEFQAWLAEGDEIEGQMETGEDPGIPAEQAFAELRAELRAMVEGEPRPA